MSVKKLIINCTCEVTVCDHAMDKVGDMLQETYDDAYDQGWRDAFFTVKSTLIDMGFDKANHMKTPPPPPRKSSRSKSSEKEMIN